MRVKLYVYVCGVWVCVCECGVWCVCVCVRIYLENATVKIIIHFRYCVDDKKGTIIIISFT